MKDPEILAAIKAKGEQADTDHEAWSARLDKHWKYFLEYMKDKYGFNLDVATEVYPLDQMLDPTGQYEEGHLLKKWHELLKALDRNPDKPLLIVREFEDTSRQRGMAVRKKRMACSLLSGVSLDTINYRDGPVPYISIKGDSEVLESKTDDLPGYMKRVVHPRPNAEDEIVIGRKDNATSEPSAFFDLSDPHVRIYPNISGDKALNIGTGLTARVPHHIILRILELQGEE